MEFNPDDFIFHDTYGVGRITEAPVGGSVSADSTTISVTFASRETKTFTGYLLSRSCHKLHPEGFRVYAFLDPAGAALKLKDEPVECILMVLEDFPGLRAKTEDFKDYLGPYVDDWKAWWEKTQQKLKDDPRIDTTNARLREYGVSFNSQSKAEQRFRAFVRQNALGEHATAFSLAKNTLELARQGHEFSAEHLEEVVDYIRNIVFSDEHSLSDRIDAVFRLKDEKYLTESQAGEQLDRIVGGGCKLYEIKEYALNRLVAYLQGKAAIPANLETLATGMCSRDETVKELTSWALKRGDAVVIEQFLLTALSENLPMPQAENYYFGYLSARLVAGGQLIRAVSPISPVWPQVIERFGLLLAALNQCQLDKASLVFGAIGTFSSQVDRHLGAAQTELEKALLEALLQPVFQKPFLFALLEGIQKTRGAEQLASKLEKHLWETGEKRGFDFITDLSQGDSLEAVISLTNLALTIDNQMLREKVGERVGELARINQKSNLPTLLLYLNRLAELPGQWSWSKVINGLREAAYLETLKRGHGPETIDHALIAAVSRYVDLNTQAIRDEKQELGIQNAELQKRVSQLENLLQEREAVIRELRSGFGGDTATARFEERSRILKDLVALLAEFERAVATHPEQSRGMSAMIKRLNNLLPNQKVVPMEAIGTQVAFDPQKHQPADPVHVEAGEVVLIFERGFLIRDLKEHMNILKPALVRKLQ